MILCHVYTVDILFLVAMNFTHVKAGYSKLEWKIVL